MSVNQEYEPSLLELVGKVREYFEAAGLNVGVGYGPKDVTKQINKGAEGRVVFELIGGSYAGPKRMGSRSKTEALRAAYTLDAEVHCHIWAWNRSEAHDDLEQERAWFRVHEYTLAAIRSRAQGRFQPTRLLPVRTPVELRDGFARTLEFTIEIPVHCPPDDEPKLTATASVTITASQPQGQDAEGDPIPPVESDVATFIAEGD
jgi:hypothetical protein